MTEQLKAEAFVREARPALMELTFGCEVKDTHNQQYYKVCNKSVNGDLFVSFGTLASSQYRIAEERIIIIGHPIQLQDWLAVLRKTGLQVHISAHQVYCRWEKPCHQIVIEKAIIFNLTDGQPCSERDYKTFNEITSV